MFITQFEVPGATDIMNANANWKYRWSHAKRWKAMVAAAVLAYRAKPPVPLTRSRLVLTRCSAVEPDPDNLAASFKPVIDGLREAGVIENDRSCNVEICYRWRKAPRGSKKMLVEVYER